MTSVAEAYWNSVRLDVAMVEVAAEDLPFRIDAFGDVVARMRRLIGTVYWHDYLTDQDRDEMFAESSRIAPRAMAAWSELSPHTFPR